MPWKACSERANPEDCSAPWRHGASKIIAASALWISARAYFDLDGGSPFAGERHHMVHLRADAYPLAQGVVMVAGHMRQHRVAALQQRGRGEHAVADEVGHKPCGGAVVQRVRIVPLVQMAFVHHA